MMISRRYSLILAGSAMAGAAVSAADADAAAPKRFDARDPRQNLLGFVKVIADLSGKARWLHGDGRIYALADGQMPIPLVGVHGLRYVRCTAEGDAFRMRVRDWGYYTDLETGAVLESFRNPLTGETNRPQPLLTPLSTWMMGPDGQRMDGFKGQAWLMDRPLRMPWSFSGNDASVTLELLVKYPNGGFGGEWMNLLTGAKEVTDRSVTSASMRYSWTGYSPWSRWMQMGDRPGRTLWNSNGHKRSDLSEVDPELRAKLDQFFPGSLADPEGYRKVMGTTNTAPG